MVEITELEEGDKIRHKETGDEKHVVDFIMNFSGEKEKAKIGFKSDDGNLLVASVGKNRLEKDESDEWEIVEESDENDEEDEDEIVTDGGEEKTECVHCGAVDEEEHGVLVGLSGHDSEETCNICRAGELEERTTLSQREAEVAALKQLTGASHERIAKILEIDKSTVDEYSRRLNSKAHTAAVTADELSEFI